MPTYLTQLHKTGSRFVRTRKLVTKLRVTLVGLAHDLVKCADHEDKPECVTTDTVGCLTATVLEQMNPSLSAIESLMDELDGLLDALLADYQRHATPDARERDNLDPEDMTPRAILCGPRVESFACDSVAPTDPAARMSGNPVNPRYYASGDGPDDAHPESEAIAEAIAERNYELGDD